MAGLACSLDLAARGYDSAVVENAPFLGGHAVKLACKATTACQNCGACLVVETIKETQSSPHITPFLSARMKRVDTGGGAFDALLVQEFPRILPDVCDLCGLCLESCPVPGAIRLSPVVGTPYIAHDACLSTRGGACSACADACPRSAVHLSASDPEFLVKSNAIVIATGFTPFDPEREPRLGYGRIQGVLTALELEELLRNQELSPAANGRQISRIGFIQCVGSRDPHIGANYCSQVCCAYALRLARLLRTEWPGIEITIFYMDIQTSERDFQKRLGEAAQEVTLCRAIPSEVRATPEGKVELFYHGSQGTNVWDSFDLVVLSVGMSPPAPIPGLESLRRNVDGFFGDTEIASLPANSGIFVAGAAQGPKSIVESMRQAAAVAERVTWHLELTSRDGSVLI